MNQSLPLLNTSVVVTRPAKQNFVTRQQLEKLGATAIAFPCIEILPNTQVDLKQLKQQLSENQILIFISSNAVNQIFLLVPEFNEIVSDDCVICAVGSSTADTLRQYGIKQVLFPNQTSDSEGLLKLPELQQIEQKLILIIKGMGGRELLYESLSRRGALVQNAEIYQRSLPKLTDIAPLTKKIDLILFTSSETVNNFLTLSPDSLQQSLLNCQTVVGHDRIAEKVTTLGFKKLPIIAATPSDTDMLNAVQQWAKDHK